MNARKVDVYWGPTITSTSIVQRVWERDNAFHGVCDVSLTRGDVRLGQLWCRNINVDAYRHCDLQDFERDD